MKVVRFFDLAELLRCCVGEEDGGMRAATAAGASSSSAAGSLTLGAALALLVGCLGVAFIFGCCPSSLAPRVGVPRLAGFFAGLFDGLHVLFKGTRVVRVAFFTLLLLPVTTLGSASTVTLMRQGLPSSALPVSMMNDLAGELLLVRLTERCEIGRLGDRFECAASGDDGKVSGSGELKRSKSAIARVTSVPTCYAVV